jgi:hypothetical protein
MQSLLEVAEGGSRSHEAFDLRSLDRGDLRTLLGSLGEELRMVSTRGAGEALIGLLESPIWGANFAAPFHFLPRW